MVKLLEISPDWKAEISQDFIDFNDNTNFTPQRNIEVLYKAAVKNIYWTNTEEIAKNANKESILQDINIAYAIMKKRFEKKFKNNENE